MTELLDSHDPAEDLTAFADGELDAARSADVLEYLSTHPETARGLARAMRFRAATARAITPTLPTASDALRSRIGQMIEEDAQAQRRRELPLWRQRMQLYMGLATAATILITVGVMTGKLMFGVEPPGPVPLRYVQAVTHIHVDCSRRPDAHNLPFPHELGELSETMKQDLGQDQPVPDLSKIGYNYIGAGPCSKPLAGFVHLLYKSTRGPARDTFSVFIEPYHDDFPIEDGKVYWAASRDSAYPILVWRRHGLIYFLVGDTSEPVVDAANLMHVNVPL